MIKFDLTDVGEVLQKLNESKIRFSIEQLPDQDFTCFIGSKESKALKVVYLDPELLDSKLIADNVSAIAHNASFQYPKSAFAKYYQSVLKSS